MPGLAPRKTQGSREVLFETGRPDDSLIGYNDPQAVGNGGFEMKATMKFLAGAAAAALLVVPAVLAPTQAEEAAAPDGKAVFLAQKCNMCHAVPSQGIEAKMTSEKMKGPDMTGQTSRLKADEVTGFLRKTGQIEGKTHSKEFTGTDAELQAVIAWLASLKAE
jgi:mono/diheme cytochrome c family protein